VTPKQTLTQKEKLPGGENEIEVFKLKMTKIFADLVKSMISLHKYWISFKVLSSYRHTVQITAV